jgi:hypothetical protein
VAPAAGESQRPAAQMPGPPDRTPAGEPRRGRPTAT